MKLNWERKEYTTWDEAFKGLAPSVRQASVRCAAYTRELYVAAASSGFEKKNPAFAGRIQGRYADLSYKCGLYHQLGKALVPPEYQILQKDFTPEEKAVYEKYTTDGAALIASLQEQGQIKKEKRRGAIDAISEIENVPWLMVREAAKSHMERFDGSGYPEGLKGEQISPIAQIVGLAKELDDLSSLVKSEDPFDEAIDKICAQEGVLWSPALIAVLKQCLDECRQVYEKYIHYTMTIPKTVPLVLKREGRPLGLNFRRMLDAKGKTAACEAIPWFTGIAGDVKNTEDTEDIEVFFKRADLTAPVCEYLLYEAADAVIRIENCRLEIGCMVINLPEGFFRLKSQLRCLNKLLEDQGVKKEFLLLAVPEDLVKKANKTVSETLDLYIRNGFKLVLDDADILEEGFEKYKDRGFKFVRPAERYNLNSQARDQITILSQMGFVFIGKGADSQESLKWQLESGMLFCSGTMTGLPMSEEDFIRDCLIKENN